MFAKTLNTIIVSLILGLLPAARATAATLRVPSQHATIAAALAAAHNGDRIIVADGVYSGAGNRDLDFVGKHVRLESANGPASCIIDCQAQGRAFYFHSGETPGVALEGFTIQNGLDRKSTRLNSSH